MTTAPDGPETLLIRARGGDSDALGQLMHVYRNYLKVLARSMTSAALRVHADPSDLVQQTCLEAARDFEEFAGSTEPALLAWLRKVLVRTVADSARHLRARRRDHRRAESLEVLLDRSSLAAQEALAAPLASPSAHAARREQAVLLADAIEQLSEDYRRVFILRSIEHKSMEEIAATMGRSLSAVRSLWTRALLALRRELKKESP
jgi:RNA polymerase sigma-70 factor (ECF subfamily)